MLLRLTLVLTVHWCHCWSLRECVTSYWSQGVTHWSGHCETLLVTLVARTWVWMLEGRWTLWRMVHPLLYPCTNHWHAYQHNIEIILFSFIIFYLPNTLTRVWSMKSLKTGLRRSGMSLSVLIINIDYIGIWYLIWRILFKPWGQWCVKIV